MPADDSPSLVDRILAQAEATPNAVAVEHGAASSSYRDLSHRSGRWAAALGDLGVRPGDRVGLSLPRGIDLAVALLAILRAGAAYVPIDAAYPSRRREQMRRFAGVTVLVTEAGETGGDAGPEAEAAVQVVSPAMLDERADAMAAAGTAAACPAGTADPEQLAYVIFTSGSTGVPKGVMLPQRTLAALLDWQRTDGGLGAPARTLQFTPVSFDVHAQEFLGTWCTGGTLVMVEDSVRRDPQQLLHFLAAQRIERLFLPFVALHQLAEAARAEPAVELVLRDVVTAGEALVRTEALVALFRRLPAARLHNHYGPSETHVATAYTLPPDPTDWPALPPIGRPVSGSQAIVLDAQGREAAPEVEGELVLGGACVGAGYIGLPEATAERFVSLPGFDGRWYRTGDLARRDAEGQLHFVGRRDGQVKIRGHRVEVGEVESVLGSLSEVAACAVVPTTVEGGGHRLVAYVVPAVAEPPVTREPSASLDAWREVWDSTYSADATEAVDPRANFSGWNSSYDGEPLDPGAMQRWVDGTRDRILREHPARVLEVGAGTGLILFAVAPHVERYDAVDFSQSAVALLARSVAYDPALRGRCSVRQGAAHEIADLSASDAVYDTVYDTVVLNSVTQHFESVGYLQQVLQQATRLLPQGGRIFVGDVTALPTRELFHATVEWAQPGAPTESALLRRRVARRCADDRELTLDARWFYRVLEADPRLSVTVQLKPGGYDNELSRYRFDVTVRVADPARVSAPDMRTVAWDPSWTASRLLDALSSGTATDAAVVRLTQVPNARLHDVQALAERLELAAPGDMGIDPDAFHALAGADIAVHTFPTSPTTYDVVLTRGTVRAAAWLTDAEVQGDPRRFASRPYLTANFAATSARLRAALTERLPEYMVPSRFVAVPSLPLTPSGKVDRQRVPDAGTARPPLPTPYVAPATPLERDIATAWARVLGLDDVGVLDNFFDLGGTSLLSLQLTQELARVTAAERTVVELFQHPTVRAYAANIAEASLEPKRTTSEAPGTSASAETPRDVAVIGMSLRFPGAASPEAFWHNLTRGVESLRHFTDDELRAAGVPESRIANPAFVKVRGLFDEPEAFDAAFFGYSARDAALMDPQHRVFLETCWSALEHSGHAPGRMPGEVGVWGGLSTGMEHNVYLLNNLHGNPAAGAPEDVLPAMLGSANDYLTTRVSHRLDLRGPSVSVQTACSTSLTAIALAYQSLVTGGCDTALAGGVAVSYPQVDGYEHQEGGIGSPDGHCRPFDADAAGTVFSNGVGVVVLKRLADALADGDQVYAVIRGVALNNDGASKMSFAAPSVDGQARVITRAQAAAGVSPETVEYVECHGTATPIGDPIEVAALTRVFGGTRRRHFCALGSVKSNFGHLDSAAGVAGFIKAVLALHHEQIPPTLHFRRPNPAIDLTESPFYVADRLIPWPRRETPRRAGVSAFGIGGTNVHVVLEEAPVPAAVAMDSGARRAEWLPISAKSASALDDATMRLTEHLEATTTGALHDAAFTLQEGRASFAHRRVVLAASAAEAARALRANDRRAVVHGRALASGGALAFLYSGGGTQYVTMGRELVHAYPVVREWVERGLAEYQARTGVDLAATWFAEQPDHPDVRAAFERPSLQLPAIFILQVALTRQWMAWGIQPAALLGHSLGENTAAHIAGVLSYKDALGLVLLRGELFECVAPGGMLSVACSPDVTARYLSAAIDLATVNGPAQCTLSGDRDALAALTQRLDADGVEYQPIPIAIAAHSHLLDPILGDFQQYLERITLHAPRIPIVSNRTGAWLSAADAQRPTYWVEHLRNTVQFAAGVSLLATDPDRVFLEMGPGKVLSSLARLEGRTPSERIIASMRHAAEPITDSEALQMAAARLWAVGAPLDWASLRRSRGGTTPRRVPLPTYPFARTRHFIAPAATAATAVPMGASLPMPAISAGPAPAPSPERSVSEPQRPMGRSAIIQQRLQVILHEMSGMPLADVDVQTTFLDMGFDSLFLTQANLRFKKEFKVKVTFRQLFDDAPTIAALAAYIDAELPADALPELVAAPPVAPASDVAPPPVASIAMSGAVSGTVSAMPALQQAIALQIQANTALLAAIQGGSVAAAAPVVSAPEAPAAAAVPAPTRPPFTPTVTRPAATGRFGPFKPVQKNLTESLSAAQEAYLAEFIARVIAKTPQSKQYTAAHRAHFADPRAVSGFKQAWKEITYPIVGDRSKGALVWDIDGNEYVDCAGGFGATFFGHAPDFVLDAVRAQMERSVDYAPQSPLAGPTAQLICSLTGHERAAFCNTGSEAVLAAMRMARTVTGNDTIVSFYGSYHGMFDEVLVRPQEVNGVRVNKPVAPGIPATAGSNLVVLEYGDPASLAYIESIADELAGVIVEPIQSRNPELQPVAFVRELRALTARLGIPLIFDEIITGFRLHPRGAQGWYDVDADLCAYGKVVGGGMPVGVVAGKAAYMDALDGGGWQYGDDSFPEAGVTYFAGTFVRHPTALAAVNAAMTRLVAEGPELQAQLNRRTALFCERVNRAYHEMGVPIELTYFASVILPRWYGHPDYESLYFHHLRYHGAHIWEGRPGFFSTAHTDEHFARLLDSFVAAARDLQQAGFLPIAATGERRPFTDAQQELWLALAMGPDARAAYNEQVLFEFATALDTEVLELTFDKVVNRHASLRSVVAADGSGIEVRRYMRPEFSVVDLRDGDRAGREAHAHRLVAAHIDREFDLTSGPLVRLLVIRLDEERTWLALSASHLVCDGWSLEVVMQDIAHFHEAMRTGRQIDRGTPPALAEYDRAWSERVAEGDVGDAEQYWTKRFSPPPEPVELPFDHPRPPVKTYRGVRQHFVVDAPAADALRAFARNQGCTLFVAALTAYDVLLHRLSGHDDLVIGIPAAGQPTLGLTGLVAHDVRFLPVREHIDAAAPLARLVEQVRRTFNDAQGARDFTYGQLLQRIRPRRDPSRLPLITAAFNLDLEMSPVTLHGARGRFLTTPRGFVKYDLFFNLIDLGAGRGLELEVDHNSDLLHEETARRWAQLFTGLLEAMPRHADTSVADVPLRAAVHDAAWALAGADTHADTAADTLVSLFEAAVDRYGESVAFSTEEASNRYVDLEAEANQIAQWLRDEEVGPDDVVAVLFERSALMLSSIYGVLKAGAAYLPLDPGNPAARLVEILAAARPRRLLCLRQDLPRLAAFLPSGIEVRAMDDPQAAWRSRSRDRLPHRAAPDHLAYVIYTSGSTGTPKGVMNTHRGIASRLRWAQRHFGLTTGDVVVQKTPYTFDVSVWELFWPLQVGARLFMARPGGHKDPRYLRETIAAQQITVAHFVPSMLNAFMAEPGVEALDSLRFVICSGEALTAAQRDRWRELQPATPLHNLYGPTEAAVDVTWWTCDAEDHSDPVPIGWPVDDTRLYILDAAGRPVPHGAHGELCIGGVQVARGYLHDEARTAERFVTLTLGGERVRVYRTGDRVRQRFDGAIEFLGRLDDQVKLRGLRIELGEVEAKLLDIDGVHAAVAFVARHGEHDDRLVAVVQPTPGVVLSQLKLRRELANKLPEYMVPQLFSVVEQLPLNASGKIDRAAVRAAVGAIAPSPGFRAPQSGAEQRIAEIWCRVLRVDRVSADAFFFDVGGHSLLALTAAREMEAAFGCRVDLRELLMSNLSQLAVQLDSLGSRVAG